MTLEERLEELEARLEALENDAEEDNFIILTCNSIPSDQIRIGVCAENLEITDLKHDRIIAFLSLSDAARLRDYIDENLDLLSDD